MTIAEIGGDFEGLLRNMMELAYVDDYDYNFLEVGKYYY
jgi:hypothetical protein